MVDSPKLPDRHRVTAAFARTVLVVDDEPMVREFALRLLESEGYRVLEAESGDRALSMLAEPSSQIDGVLLDLSMPGMHGEDILAQLRSFAPDLPVVVHSGYPIDLEAEPFADWHIAGALQKPYRAARLSEMMRTVFDAQPR